VKELQVAYSVAERRDCRALGFPRASHRYRSVRDPRAKLRIRLRDFATSRVHYGYKRLWILLGREGWGVNKKLAYRLYCEEGLGIRRRKPRQRGAFSATDVSRESLAIEVGQGLTGDDVVRVLERVTAERGRPQTIRVDNGPEFISTSLDPWAYFNGVKLDLIRAGKLTDMRNSIPATKRIDKATKSHRGPILLLIFANGSPTSRHDVAATYRPPRNYSTFLPAYCGS